jgi:hypothetical protein
VIAEADVEKAVDYLRSNAQEAAEARANVKYLTEFLKSKRAQLKVAQTGVSNAAAEDIALADPAYLQVLDGYKSAVEKDAFHSFKREAAGALIEAWRTMNANARAEGRAYT